LSQAIVRERREAANGSGAPNREQSANFSFPASQTPVIARLSRPSRPSSPPRNPVRARRAFFIAGLLVLAGCSANRPLTTTPQSDKRTSPVIRESIPQPAAAPQPMPAIGPVAAAQPPGPESAAPPTLAYAAPSSQPGIPPALALPPAVPAGTLYVCAAVVDGVPKNTAIEFIPKVKALCAKHPEMGVCQYEREACRQSGGRVFDAKGAEITKQTEGEYDKKVMRVRFRAG